MAEETNDDMRQHQRSQGAVPHGQDVPSQDLDSIVASVGRPQQSSGNGTYSAANPATKKKSSFQITSITQTKAHSRGDSNGDLNESDLVDDSSLEDVEIVGYSSDDKKNPEQNSGTNGNGASRFKVVKISRNESYGRGRWMCSDFPDSTESIPPSKENAERQDVQSLSKHVSFSNPTSNHVAGDTDIQDTHVSAKSTGEGAVASTSSTQTELEGAMKLSKKKDHDTPTIPVDTTNEFLSSNVATNTLENIDKLSAVAALGNTGDPELPIVNVIANAMEQITQIKSDLLSVVSVEVQTLRETISQLKEENEGLKQENERLRQKVEDPKNS